MTDLITIDPNPPANPGMDFGFLKAEGTELVQQLAGKIWTDYNESDPGVTILEQVCYALTELSYRAELPVQDLLTDPVDGVIHPRRQALYPAKQIFPCNPVTVKDYRKLILDRSPELGNVWLWPHRPEKATSRSVDGLYDIALYAPGLEPPPCGPAEEEEKIRGEVRRVYCRHRNLCEDARSVYILRPMRTVVHADVTIAETRTPEAILAGILFNVGLLLAPEPRRRSLKSLMDEGVAPSRIFEGPLLVNGFIDDGQLQPKAECVPVPEIVRAIARSAGVQGVRGVRVRAGGKEYSGNEHIKVRKTQILQLDTRPDKRGFSIRLFKNGAEIQPNPARVRRELDKLWADQRRTYRLAAQYDEYFGFPEGRRRDFKRYSSIQDQFPNVYGINSYGLPGGSPEPRQAQARQLKGYLMVFDQLMADFFAQLSHVRDLYSIGDETRQTYFWQSLERSVPDIAPLLKGGEEEYRQGLARIVREQDPWVERRNRFLDFLLGLYAERLDAASVWDLTPDDELDEAAGQRLIHAKRELLRHLVPSTHGRGKGFDYLERASAGNIAGMEIKCRIQLAMPVFEQRPLVDVLEELGVELEAGTMAGRSLDRHSEHIQEQLAPVASAPEEGETAAALPRGLKIPEELALGPAEVEELRMGSLPGESSVSVVWKSRSTGEWRLFGRYPDRDSAEAGCRGFRDLLRALCRHGRQLYIVEHDLLRFGRFREPDEGFVYDFTLTAVTTAGGGEDYKLFFREVIRENTPSHIVAGDLFLRPVRMREFEKLYWDWRRALRRRERREINATSAALRRFLTESREERS